MDVACNIKIILI